jgi:hypothetical protein
MPETEISHLSVMDRMVKDNNQGISLSTTLVSVTEVKQGSVIGFGVVSKYGDDAKVQIDIGVPGKYMFMCFAIDITEFYKTLEYMQKELNSETLDSKETIG